MSTLKKICSFIVIACLVIPYVAVGNTPSLVELRKNIIIEGNILKITENGEKIKKTIDRIFTKIEKNEEVIELISQKMTDIQNDGKTRTEASKQIINYIILKINYSVVKNNYSVSAIVQENIQDNSIPLSSEEKKLVNARILEIQANMFENSTDIFDIILDEFEKYSNYEETGDVEIQAKIDLGDQFIVDAEVQISDYEYKVASFDSQFKGKLDAYVDSFIQGQDDSNVKLAALIDFISQDGNIYIMLEQLKLEGIENSPLYASFKEALEKIADQEKYVKFQDEETQRVLEAFAAFTPEKLLNEGNLMFRQAMFTPYAKNGDAYLLEPTRHACDAFKKLANTFDPFNGDSCSESQYKKMLDEMKDEGFTLSLKVEGSTNTLMIDTNLGGDGEMKALMQFDSETIKKMRLAMIEDKEIIQSDKIIIDYKKNEYLNFDIDLNGSSQKFTMESVLNSSNRFDSLSFDGKSISDYFEWHSKLSLKNNTITGNFNSTSKSWDYNSNSSNPSKKMTGNIQGKTTSTGKLTSLVVTIKGQDLVLNTQPLSASVNYNSGKTGIEYNYTTEGSTLALRMNGEWDSDEKMFDAFDFALSRKVKKWEYNPTDFSRSYSGDYRDSVTSAIKLENTILSGNTKFFTEGKLFMDLKHNGNIKKGLFDWKNAFSLSDTAAKDLQRLSQSRDSITKVTGNFDIYYNDIGNTSIFTLLFNLLSAEKEIIKFYINSDTKREYKEIDIQAPSNYVDGDELLPESKFINGF